MTEPACRSADDPSKPCKYAGVCHINRQRVMVEFGINGSACDFYMRFQNGEWPPNGGIQVHADG